MRATIAVALLLAMPSQAKTICRAHEYAELKDMPTPALQETYCRYDHAMRMLLKASESNMKAGYMGAAQRDLADSNRCAQELERIERVLAAQKAERPTCPGR